MTGPEHYIEAKRLLLEARDLTPQAIARSPQQMLAQAQVHASLAAAAASAELAAEAFKSRRLSGWWRRRRQMRQAKRKWNRVRRNAAIRVLSEGQERTGFGSDIR